MQGAPARPAPDAVRGDRARRFGIAVVAASGLLGGSACGDEGDGWRVPAAPSFSGPAVCIGPRPPSSAWDAAPSGPEPEPNTGEPGPEPGSLPPAWALIDFQPQSCGYEAIYGLDAFEGRVTVVALLSGS